MPGPLPPQPVAAAPADEAPGARGAAQGPGGGRSIGSAGPGVVSFQSRLGHSEGPPGRAALCFPNKLSSPKWYNVYVVYFNKVVFLYFLGFLC